MLKSIEGIYDQGKVILKENPDHIINKTKVIVTFLDSSKPDNSETLDEILSNEKIEEILQTYRRENKNRPIGLAKGDFVVPDDFNAPLPDDILTLFETE